MDKLDQKILSELMRNSRIPLTTLAKKLKSSREVITYRINRLKQDKIIINFVTEIDLEKLGFVGAAVFVSIKANKEFKDFLNSSPFVSWVAEHTGVWDYAFSIYGKTPQEVDQRFQGLQTKFNIINHKFNFHKKNHFFYEKYFGSVGLRKKKKNKACKVDKQDLLILKELSLNSRIDSIELSKKINLTAPAIRFRIKKLEQANIIEKYSLFVDILKLDSFQYSVFVDGKKKGLLAFLLEHPKVSFVAEYLGDPFLEFGVFVKNPYQLRKVLQEIEQVYPNKVLEVSLFQQEFVSIGPPKCVFSLN